MRAHLTPQAEIDLEEIGDYIALDNPKRAVSFIREIRQHCEKIADGPRRYVARPDLGDAIRIFSSRRPPAHAYVRSHITFELRFHGLFLDPLIQRGRDLRAQGAGAR